MFKSGNSFWIQAIEPSNHGNKEQYGLLLSVMPFVTTELSNEV